MTRLSTYAFGLTEIILLFAVLQTLLLALVLLGKPGKTSTPNGFLCAFLLTLALVLVEFVLIKGGVTLRHPHLLGISMPSYFSLAPLYFLYATTLPGRKLKRADAVHLLPVLVGIISIIPFYLLPANRKIDLLLQLTGEGFAEFPLLAIFLASAISFQTIVYFYQAYDFLQQYEVAAKNESASVSLLAADWLKKLSISFCLLVLIFYLAAAELFLLYEYRQHMVSPDLFSFGIAGFIFFVSWHMYRNPELFELYTPAALPKAERASRTSKETKYQKTKLPPEQLANYAKRLLEYMGRVRPYLDGELRLLQLAENLDMPAHHLSQVINVTHQQTFFDFINRHRISHAQGLLLEPDSANNMLEIALASGFNSKASFNRIFKKVTGMTPSEFLRRESCTETGEHLTR